MSSTTPTTTLPTTMRAWQYTSTRGGLPANLYINPSAPVPIPTPTQYLVRVHYVALNPVDYKPAENYLLHRFMLPKPATPGIDFVGEVVIPVTATAAAGSASGSKDSIVQKGRLVFGMAGTSPFAGSALAEYAVVDRDSLVPVANNIDPMHAACVGVAGLTAIQSIGDRIKAGSKSRILINGGSGGTGIFGIQIAKAMGFDVTATCSGKNTALCERLGADVIDYTRGDVVATLKSRAKAKGAKPYDLVIDNVGKSPELFWQAHEYTSPTARYVSISGEPTLAYVWKTTKMRLLPGWAGGGKRKIDGLFAQVRKDDMMRIQNWMVEGKVQAVVDDVFPFEDTRKAFEKLKSWRAVGKIIVGVREAKGRD